jgi:putative ABC transport system permease protein
MAYHHVRAGFGRMALSVVAVGLGVALVVAVRIMNAAVLDSFLGTVDAMAGRATLTITAGEGLSFPEDVVEAVSAVRGVKLAVPLVSAVAFPDDGSGELLTVHGVDLTNEPAVRVYHSGSDGETIVGDLVTFLNRPDSILVGREFATDRNLRDDSTIDLATPKGIQRFTVRGVLESEGVARALGGRLMVMDILGAQRAFTGDGQINRIDLVMDEAADLEATRAAVGQVLPSGLAVHEPAFRKGVIRETIGSFQMMLGAFSLLAVVAGFVICYSRLGALFDVRTWEVGLLRAVGLRRRVVLVELLKEGLLLGAAGALLGVPLGLVIGWFGLPFVATATALNFHLPVSSTTPHLPPGTVVLGLAVGLFAAVLAAVIPAVRLARTRPVAALTMRGREMPVVSTRRPVGMGPVLLAIAAALIAWQLVSRISILGHLTTGLVALAACAFAGPIVRLGGRVIAAIWEGAFGPTGRLAGGNAVRQPRRTAMTVATLGVGLGSVLLFGILGWSFERTLVSQVTARLKSDLVITSAFISGGYVGAPLDESLVDDLRPIPGVAVSAGEQRKDLRYESGVVVLDAYDSPCFADTRVCQWPLATGALPDALARVARGDAVVVSSSFAHQHGTNPGDTIRLNSLGGPVAFVVAGITRAEPTTAVILSRDRYRDLWKDTAISWLHVVLGEGTDRATVEAAIRQRLGATHRLHVRSNAELIAYFASQARQAFSLLYLMEAITFLLVVIGMGDTLATGVVERTREFGMLRAVGMRRSRLFEMVMLEGVAIGLLGLFLAAGTGLALGVFWVEVQFPAVLGWKLDLHLPAAFGLTAAGLTLLLCLVGSVLPSLRAARLVIPEALRTE